MAFNSLAVVNISFNNFKDLSCLSAAHHLRILDISHNRICSISFVSSLSQLTSLRCHNNSIESLRELKNAPLIQELWVSNNDIQWQQYIYLSSLKSLEILIKSDKEKSNDDKKIDNFLLSVVPSLKILDGGAVKAIADQTVSIDVKIMLTQARAALQESVNIESQENNRVTASKGISKKKSPAIIGKIKRQSSKSSQVLEELDISSAVDDDGAVTSTSTTENALDSDVITSHRSAPSSRSSFANPTQSSTSGDLIAANQPANIGQVSAKHGRSTMAAARKIPKKYPGTAIIGSPNPSAEDIGSGQQLEVATTESAPRTLVKFNSTTSDAPIALCIYPNNDGYARWSRGGPMACSTENGRLLACYKAGAVALVYDRRAGNGSIMDTRGRCLFVISEYNNARVLDRVGTTLMEYHKGDSPLAAEGESAGGKVKTSWNFEGLNMNFDPEKWELTVVLENEKVKCAFSSISGCSLVQEKVDTPLSGKKEKKISQLRSPKPVSVNDGHENDNGPSEQEEVRATSLSEELQALLSGLDSAMGGLKKK
eukprot:gene23898-32294_t